MARSILLRCRANRRRRLRPTTTCTWCVTCVLPCGQDDVQAEGLEEESPQVPPGCLGAWPHGRTPRAGAAWPQPRAMIDGSMRRGGTLPVFSAGKACARGNLTRESLGRSPKDWPGHMLAVVVCLLVDRRWKIGGQGERTGVCWPEGLTACLFIGGAVS